MNKKFKIGDKVRHKTDPSYTGTVTNVKYVPKKGLSYGDYQWLLYNSDWNCLMKVVEKIESLGYWTELVGGIHHEFRIGRINQTDGFISRDSEYKIEAVCNAIVNFIEWYNSAEKE